MARSIGRKVNTGPTGVSRTVFRALVRPGHADTLREHMAPFAWKAVVSPVIAKATKALHVTNGTLTVAVKSSAWATELSMQKPELLVYWPEQSCCLYLRCTFLHLPVFRPL